MLQVVIILLLLGLLLVLGSWGIAALQRSRATRIRAATSPLVENHMVTFRMAQYRTILPERVKACDVAALTSEKRTAQAELAIRMLDRGRVPTTDMQLAAACITNLAAAFDKELLVKNVPIVDDVTLQTYADGVTAAVHALLWIPWSVKKNEKRLLDAVSSADLVQHQISLAYAADQILTDCVMIDNVAFIKTDACNILLEVPSLSNQEGLLTVTVPVFRGMLMSDNLHKLLLRPRLMRTIHVS